MIIFIRFQHFSCKMVIFVQKRNSYTSQNDHFWPKIAIFRKKTSFLYWFRWFSILKIANFDPKLLFSFKKRDFILILLIFIHKNGYFWIKASIFIDKKRNFSVISLIFDTQNYYFWPKGLFLLEMTIFAQNQHFLVKITIFGQSHYFFTKSLF